MRNGIMADLTQVIDFDTAALIANDFGYGPRREAEAEPLDLRALHHRALETDMAEGNALQARAPIVTILGHVDHGKTSLLDAIRQTKVADGEAGGITQHIGAYQVTLRDQPITFLDTPGHAAFTAMRARGAHGADIAVLVVAADDGVMPQTIEAIDHAKAANVPIIVAINKVDLPDANPDRIKTQLTEHGLVAEDFGGEVITVPVSAKAGQGIDTLLDNILVVAEVAELKADPDRLAAGVVIEAHVDRSRGPLATILVQNGTLRLGDSLVAGDAFGRVKALFDHQDRRLQLALPAQPATVLGLTDLPAPGDPLVAFPDDRSARDFLAQRLRERELKPSRVSRAPILEVLATDGAARELPLIVKTDVQGSVDAVTAALNRLSSERARIRVLHAAPGSINDSDVLLAIASGALVVGFNSEPEPGARSLAQQNAIDIRSYSVIYALIDDVEKALFGILDPVSTEVIGGHAEVRTVFSVGRRNKIAGCYVTDGRVMRSDSARLLRGGTLVATGSLASLKRFKDDAREVTAGLECGIAIDSVAEFKEGDVLELFHTQLSPAA
jgi:translation initiation factor IF-2